MYPLFRNSFTVLGLAILATACQPEQSPQQDASVQAEAPIEAEAPGTASGQPQMPDLRPGGDTMGGRPDAGMPGRETTVVDAQVTAVGLSNRGDTENNTLGAPTARFKPTDTVYLQVDTTGTDAPYTLYAKWISADGTVLSDYGMVIGDAGRKQTVLSLSKPDGWQQGRSRVELAINSSSQKTVEFEVQ